MNAASKLTLLTTAIALLGVLVLVRGEATGADPAATKMLLQRLDAKGDVGETLEVMFNPKEYTITKAVPWKHHDIQGLDAPQLKFESSLPRELSFDLEFDTAPTGADVREFVEPFEALARVDAELKRPPTVLVTWGTGLRFSCVVSQMSVRYTLFRPDGVPLRATVSATFKEYTPASEQLKGAPRH